MLIIRILLAVCFISSTVLFFPLYFHFSWLVHNDWVLLLKLKKIAVGEIRHTSLGKKKNPQCPILLYYFLQLISFNENIFDDG